MIHLYLDFLLFSFNQLLIMHIIDCTYMGLSQCQGGERAAQNAPGAWECGCECGRVIAWEEGATRFGRRDTQPTGDTSHTQLKNGTKREYLDFFCTVKVWRGQIVNMEPDKCAALEFHHIDSLPATTIDYVRCAQPRAIVHAHLLFPPRSPSSVLPLPSALSSCGSPAFTCTCALARTHTFTRACSHTCGVSCGRRGRCPRSRPTPLTLSPSPIACVNGRAVHDGRLGLANSMLGNVYSEI